MHNVDTMSAGGIDGNITCTCEWSKYAVYPNAGWGRRSVGIRRISGTKKDWVKGKLVDAYKLHIARECRIADQFGN